MNIQQLTEAVGGLSNVSKMPGLSHGTSALDCNVGGKLAEIPGSVCFGCYARKGFYVMPNTKNAHKNRQKRLLAPDWEDRMVELIERKYRNKVGRNRVFRWKDSGDLSSIEELQSIVNIAKRISSMKFWLPTKEYGIVRAWTKQHGEFPDNLNVRVSSPMIGQGPLNIPGTTSSTVNAGEGHKCPANEQDHKCLDCRACWEKDVKSVDYQEI